MSRETLNAALAGLEALPKAKIASPIVKTRDKVNKPAGVNLRYTSRLARLQREKEAQVASYTKRPHLREAGIDPYGDEKPPTTGNREKPSQEESAQ